MIAPPPSEPQSKTKIECDRTRGSNVKPGVHVYDFCPFCGHDVLETDGHELVISVPG